MYAEHSIYAFETKKAKLTWKSKQRAKAGEYTDTVFID